MNPKYTELSYDVVIPSHLLINPNIEPSAKLFYGLIRNLTKLEGYCYASNRYFEDLMEVDKRTIQRWLKSLEENLYIEIFDREGFESKRKIFISNKFLQRDISATPPVTKVSPPRDKNVIHKEDSIKEEKKIVCPKPPVGASEPKKSVKKFGTDGKEESMQLDEVYRKSIQLNNGWESTEITDAWQILCDYPGRVNDLWRFLEGTIENIRSKARLEKLKNIPKEEKKCQSHTRSGRTPTKEEIAMLTQPSPERDYLIKTLKECRIG